MSERGTISVAAARCGWALDGGALHLYAFDGETSATAALAGRADALAREHGAAVCVTTLDARDPWVEPLVAAGFERDDAELTVRGGEVRTDLTLLRVVQG
jgi:hypothetical protein